MPVSNVLANHSPKQNNFVLYRNGPHDTQRFRFVEEAVSAVPIKEAASATAQEDVRSWRHDAGYPDRAHQKNGKTLATNIQP